MAAPRVDRKLAAIMAVDVAGYSPTRPLSQTRIIKNVDRSRFKPIVVRPIVEICSMTNRVQDKIILGLDIVKALCRRVLISIILVISCQLCLTTSAAQDKTQTLRALLDTISNAGQIITSITDGIQHLVVTGTMGFDAAKARIIRARLLNISGDISGLLISQIPVVEDMSDYIEFRRRANQSNSPICVGGYDSHGRVDDCGWSLIIKDVNNTLTKVREIFEIVQNERSDFVISPTYLELMETLGARERLLQSLSEMEPPTTDVELNILSDIAIEYRSLIAQLKVILNDLNKYLAEHLAK